MTPEQTARTVLAHTLRELADGLERGDGSVVVNGDAYHVGQTREIPTTARVCCLLSLSVSVRPHCGHDGRTMFGHLWRHQHAADLPRWDDDTDEAIP